MIKLDWDHISEEKMLKLIEGIKRLNFVKEFTVYSSPSMDGYHCEIDTYWKIPKDQEFNFRFNFNDDHRRLILDMLNDDKTVRNVLFDYKIKIKGRHKMKFTREELFKYTRFDSNSEWHKNQPKKESIKSFKLESLQ